MNHKSDATPAEPPMQMVDLKAQMKHIREALDQELAEVLDSTMFIGGPKVNAFRENLERYAGVKHVIPCANGTDALQIAMMALDLKPGDEVIVPAFTYVATAEVIGLLGLTPVMVDVDLNTFNMTPELAAAAITPRTKAIVPVHLFGQSVDMAGILALAEKHGLYVIEDNAQAIGADYIFPDGRKAKTGSMGHFGCTSFFPSKNLGCYGDGGALLTNDDDLAARARMIANHGQSKQYYHDRLGVNSRLDAFQAAILNVKLPHLDAYNEARRLAADAFDAAFADMPQLITPARAPFSTHVFHQYTLCLSPLALREARTGSELREALRAHLQPLGIPAMIYYPVPLYEQQAFAAHWKGGALPVTETLCDTVFSLPMHSEHTPETIARVVRGVRSFWGAE